MQTIAWDIDDVLNDLMQAWFTTAWKPSHPMCNLSYSGIIQNPPHRLLGIPVSEYLDSLDLFRVSADARNMLPNHAVLDWLRHYGSGFRHIALTARPLDSASHISEWLFRHFSPHIRTFAVVPVRPAADVIVYDRNKSDFLRWFGKADFLVDDSEENIQQAEVFGLRGILYPQPWNCSSQTPEEALRSLAQVVEAH
jgi:hypothetical protein